ncbi:methanol/ethanol family PQQ-dependent dehydrogenase [soil metagenome]
MCLIGACSTEQSIASSYPATPAADRAIRTAMADGASWPSYGRDYTNQRYSSLAQVDTTNVSRLALAWDFRNGIVSGYETSPIVVDGTMFISTPRNHVVALDAATGAKKWEYAHQYATTIDCCGPINRGVAVYGGRVFMGTVDARLVALDAATGRKLWDVKVGDNELGYHITSAPVAVAGLVITGISCGEQGGRCYVTAYDAADGHQRWRFYTIPSPAEGGWWGKWKTTDPFGMPLGRDIAREHADSAKHADSWKNGGAPMWHAPAVDTALKLVYLNVGNAAPDEDGSVRPGDNLYSCSLVAVDLATGKLRWYFQFMPHDLWDYDAAAPIVLVDLPDSTGAIVPAAVQPGKTGWVYVVDRRTGAPIRRSEAFVPQEHFLEKPTREGVMISPSTLGGSDWSPPAYNPTLGYLFVNGNYFPQLYKLKSEQLERPAQYWGGTVLSPTGKDYGLYSAVDLRTGKIAWQHRTTRAMISGSLATAGGLTFTGLTDRHFVAFNARSGALLWDYRTKAGVNAPPITYAIKGRQYVAVAAGGNLPLNSTRGDDLLVFALDSTPAVPRVIP